MKKIFYITLILLALFFLNACSPKVDETIVLNNNEEIKIGVVKTTSTDYKSSISWYDKDLVKLSDQNLKYSMLGSSFNNPIYSGDEIYLLTEGLGNSRDAKKAISINKDKFQVKEYPVKNEAINSIAVSENYIYTINTLNSNTHIERVNKDDFGSKEIIIDNEYVTGLTAVGDKLYVFASKNLGQMQEFYLYVYNEELEIIDKKDITEYGTAQYKFMQDEDYLYVGVTYTNKDSPASLILKISIKTNGIEEIDIKEKSPNDILKYKEKILITNYELVTNQGDKITVLNSDSKEMETIELNTKTELSGIMGEILVIANQEKLSLYDIENNFELIKQIDIEKDDDSYISSLIILD